MSGYDGFPWQHLYRFPPAVYEVSLLCEDTYELIDSVVLMAENPEEAKGVAYHQFVARNGPLQHLNNGEGTTMHVRVVHQYHL